MKFETDKGIANIRSDQIEVKKGCMLVARVTMKQLEVMILETLYEWDRRRERKTKPKGELVKVELDESKKTTLARAKLIEPEVPRMTEQLMKNKIEFAWILVDMLGLDASVTIHKLNLNRNAKAIV